MRRKRVALLGSTGSIGINTLKVIDRFKDRFEVVLLTAYNNVELLGEQISRFKPGKVALAKKHIPAMVVSFRQTVKFFDVEQDLSALVSDKGIDIVVLAMTGAAALEPFLAAVTCGKRVAPANKEALVIAGDLIMAAALKSGASIIPVDSEQSAIFQALQGHRREDLHCVHLTASGGPLLRVPRSRQHRLRVADVLKHPRWKMGPKITVDSATLMNKGFEVIEALRLFSLKQDQVRVVIHPEAIVHSLVEYIDGSVIAQLSETDMRIPIQYALTHPERLTTGVTRLDLAAYGLLTFEAPDLLKFPALSLAFDVARRGGTFPAVLNAADEVAVNAFLAGELSFPGIYDIVERTVCKHRSGGPLSLSKIQSADLWARETASEYVGKQLRSGKGK